MKKFLVCLLTLCMLLGCTSALAEIPSVFPYTGEEVTLRVMGWQGYNDFNYESTVGKWIKETLGNVKLEMEIPADELTTLSELYLSSGEDMPDVILYRDPVQFMQNGYGARCVNLHDYADYMPNWQRLRKTNAHLSWYDTADGKSYILNPVRYNALSEVWYYNKDLMAKYNLEVPTNWEEMKHCMEVVCAAEPDVDGMLHTAWGQSHIVQSVGTLFGMNGKTYADLYWDYDAGEWKYSILGLEEEIKQTVAAVAECYAKGWLNPDCFTWTSAEVKAKSGSGKFLFQFPYMGADIDYMKNGVNAAIMVPPMANGLKVYQKADYVSETTDWVYVVSNTSKHPELACAFIDMLLSEEWANHMYWGVEGETFNYDENGKRVYTQEVLDLTASDVDKAWEKYGLATNKHYGTVFFSQNACIADALFAGRAPYENEYAVMAADKLESGEWTVYYPANKPDFDEGTKEEMDMITSAWSTYIGESLADFITGKKSIETDWDAFMDGLKDQGDMEWVLEQYNAAEQKPLRDQATDRTFVRP